MSAKENNNPSLIIISSPSGAGKSTICKMLLQNNSQIELSISATTRKARNSEIDGQHYFFLSKEKFTNMLQNEEFLEHAQVFDNFYGTPKKPVENAVNSGKKVLFDIDWQGARQIVEKFSADQIISIFILPPSIKELHKRLQNRAEDSEDVVLKRMDKAKDEMSHWQEYDHILINDDLQKTYQHLINLIQNPLKQTSTSRNQIENFVNQLLKEEL
jgi:guanylate kinase